MRRYIAATACMGLAAACGGSSDATASTSSMTGSATSGPTTEDPPTSGPTAGTGDTGDAPALMREPCERYLGCLAQTTPELLPAAQAAWGAEGSCWLLPMAEIQQCLDGCQTALDAAHELYPDEPACGLCLAADDCADGEDCIAGECRPAGCGDGLVGPGEVCDNQYCDEDCRGPTPCSPLQGAGCDDGEMCVFGGGKTTCVAEVPGVGLGESCDQAECAPGFTCTAGDAECPGSTCCRAYCDTAAEDCPADTTCIALTELVPNISIPPEIAAYIGICV